MKVKRQYSEAEIKELQAKGTARTFKYGTMEMALVGTHIYHQCTIDKERNYHWLGETSCRVVEDRR